jgi:hypothetical protein
MTAGLAFVLAFFTGQAFLANAVRTRPERTVTSSLALTKARWFAAPPRSLSNR